MTNDEETELGEEYGENGPTDVEREDTGDDRRERPVPWDPELIRVDPKNFSLRQILELLHADKEAGTEPEIEIAPDFQRNRVWTERQKIRLIESILLRIPLPAFYFAADKSGFMKVVDGLQRLSTIQDFADSKFPLKPEHLEYLSAKPDVAGQTFAKLGASWRRRFNTTQISVNVIDPQTPENVKFDIFKRINTGGNPLTMQEVRHCMSAPRVRALLAAFARSAAFKAVTPDKLHDHLHMDDREVVLRFCAFWLLDGWPDFPADDRTGDDTSSKWRDVPGGDGWEHYPPGLSFEEFLNAAARALGRLPDEGYRKLTEDFERAMTNAKLLFGRNAFRKWPNKTDRLHPFNRALFESWSYALCRAKPFVLSARKETIVTKVRHLMTREGPYRRAISVFTGDPENVKHRFKVAHDIVQGVSR